TPAAATAAMMRSISLSLTAGITGAMSTPVGTPAAHGSRTMRRRAAGEAARGSSRRLSSISRVVTLTNTLTSLSFASDASRSRSRRISAPLVTMLTGCRVRSSTSRTEGDLLGYVAWTGQFLFKAARSLGLVEDLRLEIDAGREIHVGMARPGVT